MKKAIDYLEPMLERREDAGQMPTLVIATVEGDIHDIGKNLVVLMLKNYGYNVIDMGKDVPCEDIVDTAIREDAAIIGLSALMTTTQLLVVPRSIPMILLIMKTPLERTNLIVYVMLKCL